MSSLAPPRAGRRAASLAALLLAAGPAPARAQGAADVFDISAWLAASALHGPFAITAAGSTSAVGTTFTDATRAMGAPMGGGQAGGSVTVEGTFEVKSQIRGSPADLRLLGTMLYHGRLRGTGRGNASTFDASKGLPPATPTVPCAGAFEGELTIEVGWKGYDAAPAQPHLRVEYTGSIACGGGVSLGVSGANQLDASGRAAVVPAPGKPDRLQARVPVYAHIAVSSPSGGDLVLGQGTFTLGATPPPEVRLEGPTCACATAAPGQVTLQARATSPEARFQRFLVEPEGKPPDQKETGGDSPTLTLTGDGATTGRTRVTALYTHRGETLRSPVHVVDFATLRKLGLPPNAWSIFAETPGGDDAPRPYLFDDQPRGHLEITARVDAFYDGNEEKQVEWTVTPAGSGLAPAGQDPDRRKVQLAGELPDAVAGFGRHEVVAHIDRGGCQCASDPRPVALFFPRDAKGRDRERPNWAVYWAQTSAGVSGLPWKVVKAMPPPMQKGGLPCHEDWQPLQNEPRAVARYEQRLGTVFLREDFLQAGCAARPDGTVDRGIDCFAVLLRHENQHRIELDGWWGPGAERYRCADDTDGDLVPNDVEEKLGCNPLLPWSCPGRPQGFPMGDIELDAYQVGWSWVPGTADREDWACPGRQCPGHPDN